MFAHPLPPRKIDKQPILDKMFALRELFLLPFYSEEGVKEIFTSWLSLGNGQTYKKEFEALNAEFVVLLEKYHAVADYKEALLGEGEKGGWSFQCGLRHGITVVMSQFFDDFPALLVFFHDKVFAKNSTIEKIANQFSKYVDEIKNVTVNVDSQTTGGEYKQMTRSEQQKWVDQKNIDLKNDSSHRFFQDSEKRKNRTETVTLMFARKSVVSNEDYGLLMGDFFNIKKKYEEPTDIEISFEEICERILVVYKNNSLGRGR